MRGAGGAGDAGTALWVLCQQLVLGKGASPAELIPHPFFSFTHTHTCTHAPTRTRSPTPRPAAELPLRKPRQHSTHRACDLVIAALKRPKSRICPPLTRPALPPGFPSAQSPAFISNSHAPPFACSPKLLSKQNRELKKNAKPTTIKSNLNCVSPPVSVPRENDPCFGHDLG